MSDGDGGRQTDADGQRVIPASEVETIVQNAVNRVAQNFESKADQLSNELNDIKTQNTEQTKKSFTRQQLATAVEAERITQPEADAIWDQQQDEKLTNTVTSAVTDIMTTTNLARDLNAKISVYTSKIPELMTKDSDARKKVEQEVVAQMSIQGVTKPTLAIEYQALRTLYGAPETLQSVNTDTHDRQSSQDTHMAGGGAEDMTNDKGEVQFNKDGSVKGLSSDEKRFYQDLIDKGIYQEGWEDVAAELKFSNKQLRNRATARG